MQMGSRNIVGMALAVLSFSLAAQASADVIFSDGTFSTANWTVVSVVGGAGGQTAQQIETGGNTGGSPDSFWEATTNTNAVVYTAHINNLFTYDPSLGAVGSIDFAVDFRNISFFGQGMSFGLAVLQSGTYYYAAATISGSQQDLNWHTYTPSTVQESGFSVFGGGTGTPDFDGAPMTFGLLTANDGGNTIKVGYDDYFVRLNGAVPEPATVSALALGALALARRRIKRPT